MRNLAIGLVLGVILGVATSTLMAQRRADTFPDAVTADPKHYSVSFENDVRVPARELMVGVRSRSCTGISGVRGFLTDQTFNFTLPGWDHRACRFRPAPSVQ